MANRSKEYVACQLQSEVENVKSSKGLPFRDLLSEEKIKAVLQQEGVKFRDRVFNPMVTLWAFLSQAIAGNSSCDDAVSCVNADRVAKHKPACSPDSNSYCQARLRLPEQVLKILTRKTGEDLHRQAQATWLWKERQVKIVDGSSSTMADTKENQAEYPQSSGQKPGLGFPILRFVVLLSLSVGTVLECAIGACCAKNTSEHALFRQMWDALEPGDILLGDRLYDGYRDIALLKSRGVDIVFGKKPSRQCDFRKGRKLGANDHVVMWKKPKYDSSRFASKEEWDSLPDEMQMREARLTVRREGFKTRTVIIVTTLIDGELYSGKELTDLFAARWHCELDLRSIKQSLGMNHLKCKTPEMVRKELWIHLLAYNLIRVRMAQAAALSEKLPRTLSFTAARNHIRNFAPHLSTTAGSEQQRLELEMLKAIAHSRVGNRPGRKEPRCIKKRVQKYSYLTKPRNQARKQLAA